MGSIKSKESFQLSFTTAVENNDTVKILEHIRDHPSLFHSYEVYCLYKAVYHLNLTVIRFILFVSRIRITRDDFLTLWNYSVSVPRDQITDTEKYLQIMEVIYWYQQAYFSSSLYHILLQDAQCFGNTLVWKMLVEKGKIVERITEQKEISTP